MKQIHVIVDGKDVVIPKSSVRSDILFNDEDAPEGKGSAIPPEPQPTPSTSQLNVLEPQNESLQTETPPTVSHELQTEAHIEQILPSPSTYQRGDNVERAITTDSSLVVAQGSDNILKTQSTTMSNDPLSQEIGSGDRPRRQDTTLGEDSMEYHNDLMDFVPPRPHDSPLLGGNTPGSDEGRLELIQELMETCTSLTKRVLALEEAKTAQERVITRLKLRVKRLEKKRKARTPQPIKRRLFKGRVEISTDKSLEVIVEDKGSGEKGGSTADQVSTARPEVNAASVPMNVGAATPSTPPTTTTIFGDEDLTNSLTLVKIRSEKAKEKEKGVVLIDEEEPPRLNRSTTTLQPLPTINPKDKGKGVLVEEEPEKPVKVKRRDQGLAQIDSDAELAQRLHEEELAELDIAQKERKKQEEATSAALAEEFDEIQARIDADHELAKKETIGSRKSKGKYTHKQLKHKNFEEVQKLYEREMKWVDDFKPIDDNSQQQAESTKKRPKANSEEESSKKQKLEEDNDAEKEELRDSMDVVPMDDVAIDVEFLATKYPIVD
ncbi:hypothetical protein Tco_1426776 [Tanacetum coccineum]